MNETKLFFSFILIILTFTIKKLEYLQKFMVSTYYFAKSILKIHCL